MSFAKCAVKWMVVTIILCPISLPYKMAEVSTCNGFQLDLCIIGYVD